MIFLDTFLKGLKPQFDDDIVDRINYYYTPMIIIIFSLTLSAKQYVGQAIQCWVPAQFTGPWEQYSENYCFVQNTYFLPLDHHIPKNLNEREDREIGYYQWVPFVLALQAILFYLPCLFWRLLNWQSGVTVKGIIASAMDVKNMEEEPRRKNVEVVASHLHDCLDLQRDLRKDGRFFGWLFYGKHYGSYVTGLYLFVKFLYIINVISQFFILNDFLGPNYTFWGFEILRDLFAGREWQESGHFPRVTMCDFDVRVLGNLHRHTVQCVLMINMFNEKIFLFLWWWFLIVAVTTIVSFFYWIAASVMKDRQRQFIHRYLRVSENMQDSPADLRAIHNFVHKSLRPDGVFLLRMISSNAGDLLTNEIIDALWAGYRKRNQHPPPPRITGGGVGANTPDSKEPLIQDDDGFVEHPYSASSDLPVKSSLDSSPRSN